MGRKTNLDLQHISKSFGTSQALKDIHFSIDEGEIVGFLGPSGAGKTTTIKIVTGQLKQTSGEATILGKDSRKITEDIYQKVGIVSDNSGFYEKMSVYDNLLYFAELLNVKKDRIDELLKRTNLYSHKKKLAEKLSRGQGQRLVLARAILHQPKILFLDEPTSGLDPSTTLEIHKLLLEQKEKGMSIFLTTHNMEEASKLCDKVALIHEGKIVEFGTPKELCLKHNNSKEYKILLSNQEEHTLGSSVEDRAKIQEFFDQGVIETIHSNEPTLESVFLKVTGRELS